MATRFREANLLDLDGLVALVGRANETYYEWAGAGWSPPEPVRERGHWSSRIAEDGAWAAVAERDGRAVGCASFEPADGRNGVAYLSRLFVDPKLWRAGIGSALLGEAIAEMRERDFEWAELYAAAGNASARVFYERRGWRAEDQTRHWHGLTLIRFSLDLALLPSA